MEKNNIIINIENKQRVEKIISYLHSGSSYGNKIFFKTQCGCCSLTYSLTKLMMMTQHVNDVNINPAPH